MADCTRRTQRQRLMKGPTLFKDHTVSAADGTCVCQLLLSGTCECGIINIQMMVCALGRSSFVELI